MSIRSRLTRLESTRRENDHKASNPNAPRTFAEIMAYAGAPLPPGVTFASIMANAEGSDPPADDDAWGQNVINVDSEFLKITGDLEGWRENEKKIKRWSKEWEQKNWPDLKREGE